MTEEDNTANNSAPSEGKTPEQERDEYLAGWQRAKADLVNYKKEASKRDANLKSHIEADVIADLLPVLDSFDLAIGNEESWSKVEPEWRKGVEYIHSQLVSVLGDRKLTSFGAVGDLFDPLLHNSSGSEDAKSESDDGKIMKVLQKGYKIGEDVIRPANVITGRYKG